MKLLLPEYRGATPGSFFQDYLDGIEAAAAELGHQTRRFGYERIGETAPEEEKSLYRLLAQDDVDLVIDLCCWGYALSRLRVWDGSGEGAGVFDSVGAAYVGLLCDQPYYQPLPGIRSQRPYIAAPDRGHAEQIAMLYPQLAGVPVIFMPPAARAANDRSQPQRDIDLLYLGNLDHDALTRLWRGSEEQRACDALADRALASPETPLHRVLAEMLRDRPPAAPEELAQWLVRVEYFLRARYRLDAVQAAAESGVRLHLVGQGWDAFTWPSTVTLQRETSYEQFFRLAGRSRAGLDASTYLGGANDRVFNYTVNRCLVISNATQYLAEAFGTTGWRGYGLRAPEALAHAIRRALADPQREAEAEAARTTALASHTWPQRLAALLAAIQAGQG